MPRSTSRAASPRSLKVSDGFKSFVLDQLEELGDVAPKSMFGGVGLYHRGVFFGILARDTLYLKVDDANRADYERAKMKPFKPYPNRSGTMKYYAVPLDVLESPPELAAWARKAIAVAQTRRKPLAGRHRSGEASRFVSGVAQRKCRASSLS